MHRNETPKPIWIKFGMVVDMPDIVTYTNFGDHQLRGFRVAGGHISSFPIDFHHRPYNTLALQCKSVIVMKAISRELRVVLPWELLYTDDLAVIAETEGVD